MTISILITNYNTWALTLRAVRSVLVHADVGGGPEIIVVDDASDDDPDVMAILGGIPNLRLHRNKTNLGYVRSVNLGVGLCQSDLVLLLDSDAYLLNTFERPLTELFTINLGLGAVGLRLVNEQGTPTGNADSEPSVWTLLLGQRLFGTFATAQPSSDLVLFSCGIAFRKIAFTAVGGFDEQFDFLDADIDFSMSLRRHGWEIATTENVIAYHTGGGSPQLTARRVTRFYKNRYLLLTKYRKVKCVTCLRSVLLARIMAEYGFLKLAAPWLYANPSVRQDKLNGRRMLIQLIYNRFV